MISFPALVLRFSITYLLSIKILLALPSIFKIPGTVTTTLTASATKLNDNQDPDLPPNLPLLGSLPSNLPRKSFFQSNPLCSDTWFWEGSFISTRVGFHGFFTYLGDWCYGD